MIPVLIGAAAVAAGAYALSGDDKTKTKRYVNENGDWVDVLNKQKISESEIPPEILRRARRIDDETEFGLALDIDGAINFCPHCGTKVRNANAKFCVKCGKALVDN